MPRLEYSSEELDHFYHPRNVGTLPPGTPFLHQSTSGFPGAGEILQLQLVCPPGEGRIKTARFKAAGSPSIIAVGSWLTCFLGNLPIEEARHITPETIMQGLQMAEVRIHCAQMAVEALQKSLDQV